MELSSLIVHSGTKYDRQSPCNNNTASGYRKSRKAIKRQARASCASSLRMVSLLPNERGNVVEINDGAAV